jgi:hypothetical protein
LVAGVGNAGAASWSPDGQWLTLPMVPRDGGEGLWLVNARNL